MTTATKEAPATDRPILSVREAAELLGWSRDIVYRMVKRGDLPSVTINGRLMLPRGALQQWISDREKEALASMARQPRRTRRPKE